MTLQLNWQSTCLLSMGLGNRSPSESPYGVLLQRQKSGLITRISSRLEQNLSSNLRHATKNSQVGMPFSGVHKVSVKHPSMLPQSSRLKTLAFHARGRGSNPLGSTKASVQCKYVMRNTVNTWTWNITETKLNGGFYCLHR